MWNKAFMWDFLQKVKVEDVKTKLSCETSLKKTKLWCETSLKKWKWKMWKQSFRARRPYKSDSGKCETEAFVWDVPQKMKVKDVKTKLSCETSLKKWKVKMCKRSFRPWPPSNLKVEVVKMKPELSVPQWGRSDHDPHLDERVLQACPGQASPSIFRGTFCPAKQSISCIR